MADRIPNRRSLRRWQPRHARSSRNRRRTSPFHVAMRFVLVGLGALGLWWAFHSPSLAVRQVEVIGAQRLNAAHLVRQASIPVGQNIFRVNLYRARIAVEAD